MVTCVVNKIDSNITGLAYAEEDCPKILPAAPIWYGLEPNSYSDFGGSLSTTARAPIDPSRQRKKGTVTGLEASGGFNIDFTQTNLQRLMQGFFFAARREKPTTKPMNAPQIPVTAVGATGKKYTAAVTAGKFLVGGLLLASGFANGANNGLKHIAGGDATGVTTVEALADDASPSANAKIELVGFEFGVGNVGIVVSATNITLNITGADATTFGLAPGEWLGIGSDDATKRFSNNVGFARVVSVTATAIALEKATWAAATEVGTGKSIQIYFMNFVRNESSTLSRRFSYQLERQLGLDAGGVQSETLTGAIPNNFTLNLAQEDKLNADLTFVALDNEQREGFEGIKAGARVAALGEDAFNTSSDIYAINMSVNNPANIQEPSLFSFVTEATLTINNGVTANKAIGNIAAIDTTAGNFEAGGSITAYFSTVKALKAVRNNSDVGLYFIGGSKNSGFVFDIPLLSLGGGRVTIEKDQAVTVPLEPAGAANANGYTMLAGWFSYLPTILN